MTRNGSPSPIRNLQNAEPVHFTRPIYYEEGKKRPCFPFYQLFSTDFPSFLPGWSPFDEFPSNEWNRYAKPGGYSFYPRATSQKFAWIDYHTRSEHSDAIFENIRLVFLSVNLSWLREIKSNPRQKRKKGTLLRRDIKSIQNNVRIERRIDWNWTTLNIARIWCLNRSYCSKNHLLPTVRSYNRFELRINERSGLI